MFDKITYISNNGCNILLKGGEAVTTNLMNMHLVFEDDTKKVLGEVDDLDGNVVKARFLGEIVGDRLVGGTIRKPSLDAKIRVIDKSEIPLITGTDTKGFMKLGVSPFYDDFPVFLDVNNFFSNHFAIFGNTGSGKSCGTSRLFQNMFHDSRLNPYKANILIFDSSGEYYNAFSNLNQINSNYNYRFISTNETEGLGEKLRLPIYLLNKDDLALLLQCTSHSQLPIIERMLKLALVFSQNDVDSNAFKNHLIAKAIMTILYTNETAPNKRNEIFSILASCSTEEFNLEAPVQGVGYVRKFRECFLIDNSGNFTESVLLTEYLNSFIKEEFDNYEPHAGVYYNLDTLEKALNFTLISEGWLRNEQTYGDAVTLRVRLHALIVGDNAKYFDVEEYVSLETYLSSLLITNGLKYQIVNINLNDIDDDFAKVLTKVYSRLIFDFSKGLKKRGSIPFHIILEEAHRYIQSDHDRFLFGYNIFERIAKEGRKYGVILGLISQRPVEISDTVISQCTNFLIFKINHPVDVEYIRKMVPNITDEIIEKQKSLQSGTCLGFGLGFKIPLIVKMEMPNPSPLSSNCDVVKIWCGDGKTVSSSNSTAPVAAPVATPVVAPAPTIINEPQSNVNSEPIVNLVVDEPVISPIMENSVSNKVDEKPLAENQIINTSGVIDNNVSQVINNVSSTNSVVDEGQIGPVVSKPKIEGETDIPNVNMPTNISTDDSKFDDSFIVREDSDNDSDSLFDSMQINENINSSDSKQSNDVNPSLDFLNISNVNASSTADVVEKPAPVGLPEIAPVSVNSSGMTDGPEPLIDLNLDDDDDNDINFD